MVYILPPRNASQRALSRGIRLEQTKKERNPETGRKTSRPESDWKRVDVPEWRIASNELWERVQLRIRFVKERFSSAQVGGFTRTERCKKYIFSGFMICGVCGAGMVIVTGSGKRAYMKYGCLSHHYCGICSNGLMIRQDRLEVQLIAGLTLKAAGEVASRQNRRRELKEQAQNLGSAIAQMGHSTTLLQQLAGIGVRD